LPPPITPSHRNVAVLSARASGRRARHPAGVGSTSLHRPGPVAGRDQQAQQALLRPHEQLDHLLSKDQATRRSTWGLAALVRTLVSSRPAGSPGSNAFVRRWNELNAGNVLRGGGLAAHSPADERARKTNAGPTPVEHWSNARQPPRPCRRSRRPSSPLKRRCNAGRTRLRHFKVLPPLKGP
jgi:hypothetical protein